MGTKEAGCQVLHLFGSKPWISQESCLEVPLSLNLEVTSLEVASLEVVGVVVVEFGFDKLVVSPTCWVEVAGGQGFRVRRLLQLGRRPIKQHLD